MVNCEKTSDNQLHNRKWNENIESTYQKIKIDKTVSFAALIVFQLKGEASFCFQQTSFYLIMACNVTSGSGASKGLENAMTSCVKGKLEGEWYSCLVVFLIN